MVLWLFWHITYRTSGQFSSLLSDTLLIQNIFTRHPEMESQVCQFPFCVSSLENWKLQLVSIGGLIAQYPNLTHWNKIITKVQKMVLDLCETRLFFLKKHCLISSSGVKWGKIGDLKTLMKYRSTIMLQLLRQSYCIIRLIFPWTCPGLQSKRAIFNIFMLCNFQFSQFSELQVSAFFWETCKSEENSRQRSHILISLDFTARFQKLLKLPKKKNVCYSITDDNIVQPGVFPSTQCCESLSNVISLGQEV